MLEWDEREEHTEPDLGSRPDPTNRKKVAAYIKKLRVIRSSLPMTKWGNSQRKVINHQMMAVLRDVRTRKAHHKSKR